MNLHQKNLPPKMGGGLGVKEKIYWWGYPTWEISLKMGGNDPSANSSTSKIQVCIQAELSEKIRRALRNKICTFSSIFDKCCEFSPLANHFF